MTPDAEALPLTAEELQQIRERCAQATPGPWEAEPTASSWLGGDIIAACVRYRHDVQMNNWRSSPVAMCLLNGAGRTQSAGSHRPVEDAAFIAHARTDLPRLLAEIERLQAERPPENLPPKNEVMPSEPSLSSRHGHNAASVIPEGRVSGQPNAQTVRGPWWPAETLFKIDGRLSGESAIPAERASDGLRAKVLSRIKLVQRDLEVIWNAVMHDGRPRSELVGDEVDTVAQATLAAQEILGFTRGEIERGELAALPGAPPEQA